LHSEGSKVLIERQQKNYVSKRNWPPQLEKARKNFTAYQLT